MKTRNLLTTKTMQGGILMLASFIVLATPNLNIFIDRKFPKQAEDIKFYISLAGTVVGLFKVGSGRYQATDDVEIPGILASQAVKSEAKDE
jgi:hypothetical protein